MAGALHEDLCTFMTIFVMNYAMATLVTKVPVLPSLPRLWKFLWLPDLPVFIICYSHQNVLEYFSLQTFPLLFVLLQWMRQVHYVYCTTALDRTVALGILLLCTAPIYLTHFVAVYSTNLLDSFKYW